jgi:hypothetical protein
MNDGTYFCKPCKGSGKELRYESVGNISPRRCACFYNTTICFHSENYKNCKIVEGANECKVCGGKGYITWLDMVFENVYVR